jgi:hypothetical protein
VPCIARIEVDPVPSLRETLRGPNPRRGSKPGHTRSWVGAAGIGDGTFGEGFRTPAMQAVVSHEAGVRKPPMHEPAGRGRGYGDLRNLLSRRGWRDDRCGRRGDPDVPPDGGVGRRDRSAGVPSTCRDDAGRPDLRVSRAVSDPVIAAGTPSPGGRSTATLLAGRG